MRRRRDDAAKKKKTKSNNVVENELRALKRKYYPGDGTSLQNGDVSLKSIADKKTKGEVQTRARIGRRSGDGKSEAERYAMMIGAAYKRWRRKTAKRRGGFNKRRLLNTWT